MRILMLLDAPFPPDVRVEKEIGTLVGEGHEVHVLCYRFDRSVPEEETVAGAAVHRLYIHRQVAKKALGFIFQFPFYTRFWKKGISKIVSRVNPDVVHVHDLPLSLPVMEALAGPRGTRPRFVLDLHENYPDLLRHSSVGMDFPQRLFFRFDQWYGLERDATQFADHVIVVSEDNGARLIEEFRLDTPVTVVPNAVSLGAFEWVEPTEKTRSFFRPDHVNLLYVGGMDPMRGLETVLEALVEVSGDKQPYNLVLLGGGPSRAALEDLVHDRSLSSIVQFAGHVPQRTVGEFIACADICLLPLKKTRHTDLTDPNKLYQYAYLGKPIIAAATTLLRKRIDAMGSGEVYEPDDPGSLAGVLRRMGENPGLRDGYGTTGRKSVIETFNWEAQSRPLVRLYEEMEAEVGH